MKSPTVMQTNGLWCLNKPSGGEWMRSTSHEACAEFAFKNSDCESVRVIDGADREVVRYERGGRVIDMYNI